jgi:endonuclease/exonuclease/phosphatase family metal-dependent hydrolase
MRVATLNIASGRGAGGALTDAAGLTAAVAGLDAEVVAVQEVDTGQPRSHRIDQPAVLAAALGAADWRSAPTVAGMPRVWQPIVPVGLRGPGDDGRGPRYGIALFSRVPVRRWKVLGLRSAWRKPAPDRRTGRWAMWWFLEEPRAAIAAELDGLTVVGTHLSAVPYTAAWQLRQVRAWAMRLTGPVVVAGDLNLIGPLPAVITGGTRLVTGLTYPAHAPRMQIDHVLSLDGLTGTDPNVRRLPIGDHCCASVTVHPRPAILPRG